MLIVESNYIEKIKTQNHRQRSCTVMFRYVYLLYLIQIDFSIANDYLHTEWYNNCVHILSSMSTKHTWSFSPFY